MLFVSLSVSKTIKIECIIIIYFFINHLLRHIQITIAEVYRGNTVL